MEETTTKLERLLKETQDFLLTCAPEKLNAKPSENKWSKKEILGHLVDSAINNLQRFTEIQYETKPYRVRKYNQDALVKANHYQNADVQEILTFWLAINKRILLIMHGQTEETLHYEILLDQEKKSDLRFLMEDYVHHMEHHLQQIMHQ